MLHRLVSASLIPIAVVAANAVTSTRLPSRYSAIEALSSSMGSRPSKSSRETSLSWLTLTRQGGRHKASLYAVSFFNIDYCRGKLDVGATASPGNGWRRLPQPVPSLAPTRWPQSKSVRAVLPLEKLRELARLP